jgi:uncharacterized protein (TIGR02145 family)
MKPTPALFKLISLFAGILLQLQVQAQAPEKMSYQAVIRDNNDQLVTNNNIGMQISIIQGSPAGTPVYIERHFPTTNENGLVTVEIGSGTVVTGSFTAIDWANGTFFFKTETDLNGGISYTISGTSQILSVPYALHAKEAEKITGIISETDPVFAASVAAGITGADTNKWNGADSILKTHMDELNLIDQLVDKFLWILDSSEARVLVKDIDGNLYKAVIIGTQTWMAENLKTTRLNDGTPIPDVADNSEWHNLSSPAYCWYINDSVEVGTINDPLYNWYTVNTGKLCPAGWHVPTDAEWDTLSDYLGGESVAGGKLKATGTIEDGDGLWFSPNTGATNETGFTALPEGLRSHYGEFSTAMSCAYWWSATEYETNIVWCRYIHYFFSDFSIGSYPRGYGLSVRCVKDN